MRGETHKNLAHQFAIDVGVVSDVAMPVNDQPATPILQIIDGLQAVFGVAGEPIQAGENDDVAGAENGFCNRRARHEILSTRDACIFQPGDAVVRQLVGLGRAFNHAALAIQAGVGSLLFCADSRVTVNFSVGFHYACSPSTNSMFLIQNQTGRGPLL